MVCYNNYQPPMMDSYNHSAPSNSCFGGGEGFSCIINLIIILVVLQFLTSILCPTTCDIC